MSTVLNMTGGGGAGVNLKIVGGTTQPASAKANTIWVNTDAAITGWALSATEPDEPSEGLLWIKAGASSPSAMNVLKKNVLMIYPTATAQYVSGAWVDRAAKTYDGTAWVDWYIFLYTNGDECTDLTGGWAQGGQMDTSVGFNNNASLSKGAASMTVSAAAVGGYLLSTANLIDLTSFSKLYMVVSDETGLAEDGRGPGAWLTVRSLKSGSWNPTGSLSTLPPGTVASKSFNAPGIVELDISYLTGSYYVGFALAGYVAKTVTISAFYLEQ